MANSGTVTAGSAALASQYNNLRDDVLNISTGHTHTGASENGAKIEGTVIKSTGATNGQVLAANGAGGAAFTTLAQSGAVSFISGTAAFSTATDGGSVFFYTSGPSSYNYFGLTGGGTVILHHTGFASTFTSTQTLYRRAIDSDTIVASTALAPATAGTTLRLLGGYGFNAGTAFVVLENGKNTTVQTVTLRKLNVAMTSVMWSTQILSATYTGSLSESISPFSTGAGGIRYASGPGIWYGGDYRTQNHAAGTAQEAKVWVVNDVSGSAYSAAFGSATGTADADQNTLVTGVLFVPSATAATNGTIHAWGYNGYKPRYCTYSVGSASITALSTADGKSGGTVITNTSLVRNFPAPFNAITPNPQAYWLASQERILLWSSINISVWDRTFSTAIYEGPFTSGINYPVRETLDCGAFDPTTMLAHDGGTWMQYGTVDGAIAPLGTGFNSDQNTFYTYYGILAGNGSATHQFNSYYNTGGTVQSMQIAGLAKISFGTASSRRLITLFPDDKQKVMSVNAAGGYMLSNGGGTTNSAPPIQFIAGTAETFVTLRQPLPNNSSAAGAFHNPQGNLTMGGTAVIRAVSQALA